MKAILTALLMAVVLTACGSAQPKSVERVVYKFVRVPTELTAGVAVTAPPEPVAYSTMSTDKQESVLMRLVQDHHKSINTCNARLYGIHVWSNNQVEIYEPQIEAHEPVTP